MISGNRVILTHASGVRLADLFEISEKFRLDRFLLFPPRGRNPRRPAFCILSTWSVSIFSLLVQRESGQKEKARQGKRFRFPFPWTPSLKRQRRGLLPSFDSPRRCAGLRDTRQRRTFPQVRQSPHLFSPRGTGRRGRRPLHTYSDCSRDQGLRLPIHLAANAVCGPLPKGSGAQSGAAAEITSCLLLPPAAAGRNPLRGGLVRRLNASFSAQWRGDP